MKERFTAIEGLRGWLAWAVFLNHLAYFADFKAAGPVMKFMGTPAVLTFIIVSGFVITHLLLNRPEPYHTYLLRRLMRIFPVFAVTCVAGYFAYRFPRVVNDQDFERLMTNVAAATDAYFWRDVAAHLPMLHSVISDNILPYSHLAFNMPAWSLSLEWQFYLLAPLLVLLSVRYPLLMAMLTFVGLYLSKREWFGDAPAFLPALGGYFAVGIACRLAYPMIAGSKVVFDVAVLAALVILLTLTGSKPLVIWLIVFLGFTLNLEGVPAHLYHAAFESRLATYFGSRSYSIYLSHLPIIMVCSGFFSTPPNFIVFLAMTASVTMAVSEVLYRTVEQPGIRLGTELAKRFATSTAQTSFKSDQMREPPKLQPKL